MGAFDFGLTSLAARRRGGGAAFSPLHLAPLAWYDPASPDTLFQDAAGTIAVTQDGDPVGRICDRSGHGHDLMQPDPAKRPIWRQQDGRCWIESDGITQMMAADTRFGLGPNPDISVIAGLRLISATLGDHRLFHIGDGAAARTLGGSLGTDGFAWRYNNGNAIFAQASIGEDALASWVRPAGGTYAAAQLYLNGAQHEARSINGAANTPNATHAAFSLFGRAGPAPIATHLRLYGLIVAGFDDGPKRARLESWLAARAGIAL
ncbi:MAG: hypothetical protein WDA25_06650 [Paracoccaceae bacterium]